MNSTDKNKNTGFEDFYLKLREKIRRWSREGRLAKRAGKWTDDFVQYLLILPDLTYLKIKLLFDRDVSPTIKSYIMIGLAYLISPIDFLPDLIPVFGFVDDLLILTILLNKIINSKDPGIIRKIQQYWIGEEDIFEKVREIVSLINELASRIPQGILNFMKNRG
jgi:uncharacterized membrane protein YkvA (DUF1232 family)